MTVRRILKHKGDHGVITVAPGTKVSEAVALLAEKRIGTVVVSPDGTRAEGILSERDVVRVLAKDGPVALDRPVEDLMTRGVETCPIDERADQVLARMTEGRFRHMPVVDGDEMIALISLGDVVKMRLEEVRAERDALEDMVMGR
jgi:CBS domain-containing protein